MASHLAWDIRTATETFNNLPITNNEDYPSRFVMTDGGLILYNDGGIARYGIKNCLIDLTPFS